MFFNLWLYDTISVHQLCMDMRWCAAKIVARWVPDDNDNSFEVSQAINLPGIAFGNLSDVKNQKLHMF